MQPLLNTTAGKLGMGARTGRIGRTGRVIQGDDRRKTLTAAKAQGSVDHVLQGTGDTNVRSVHDSHDFVPKTQDPRSKTPNTIHSGEGKDRPQGS